MQDHSRTEVEELQHKAHLRWGTYHLEFGGQKIIFGPVAASEKVVHFETQIPYLSVKARIEGQEVGLLVDSGTWGLLVYRNPLRTAPEQLHVDPNASISIAGDRVTPTGFPLRCR